MKLRNEILTQSNGWTITDDFTGRRGLHVVKAARVVDGLTRCLAEFVGDGEPYLRPCFAPCVIA